MFCFYNPFYRSHQIPYSNQAKFVLLKNNHSNHKGSTNGFKTLPSKFSQPEKIQYNSSKSSSLKPVKPAKPAHLLPNSYSYSNPSVKRYIPDDSANSDFHYEKQGQTRHVEKQQHTDYSTSASSSCIQAQLSTIIPTRHAFVKILYLYLLFFYSGHQKIQIVCVLSHHTILPEVTEKLNKI